LRGLIIGVLITLVFTAANVFFRPQGRTHLRHVDSGGGDFDGGAARLRDATIQENNIVQTVASAAGTLSSVIFVLPGLVMIGWWNGFPYVYSCAICALAECSA